MIKKTDKRIKNVDLKISLPVSILKKCKYLLMHNNRDTNVMNKNIIPVKKTTGFSLQGPMVYEFPPNSLTIMRLKFD